MKHLQVYPRGKRASRRFALLQGFYFPLTVSTNLSHGSDFFGGRGLGVTIWNDLWIPRKIPNLLSALSKSIRYTYALW